MMKKLLTLAAVVAAAFSANADTLDLSLADLGSGWDSSYDAATQTITYEKAWGGRGWWFGTGASAKDFSAYDEIVIETVDNTMAYNIVIEYDNTEVESTSVSISADKAKGIAAFDEVGKAAVKQIYLQGHAVGTIKLAAAYVQNAAVVDPSAPVVLFEGEKAIDWWSNAVDLTPADFVAAKCVAGDKVTVTYAAEEANGFKLVAVKKDWSSGIVPFMTSWPNFNATDEVITLPAAETEFTFDIDAEAAALLTDAATYQTYKFCGDKVTVTKIVLLHKEATTGIADAMVEDANAPVEYYNLQGVRVAEPANGLYIRRQGNKATKVLVK